MSVSKKILLKAKYVIIYFFGGFVVCLFKILNIFFNFRFGQIYTSRVGHLCHNVDSYLSSRKNNEIAIFGVQSKIANKLILDLWKKKKKIFFSRIGLFGYHFLNKFFPDSKMLIKWEQLYPNYSAIMLKKKNFITNDLKNFKVLDKFIPKKPFICFHNRDNEYLKVIDSDNNDHDFRDYEFKDYKMSIDYVLNNKIQPVRIGRITKDKKKNYSLFYHDYTNENSNDTNDLYLIKNCKFLVASSTGLANIASILRKKILFVNFIPFCFREMYQYTAGSIFLPKKLYDLKKRKYLKFSEIENLQYDIHEKNFFKKRNIKVIDNTEFEIYSATKEMLQNCQKKKKNYKSILHDNFWSSFRDKKAVNIIRNKLNFNICDSFLKQNKKLI